LKVFYDTIIISPHLDDAALSCGAQIYMKTAVGQAVLIVTPMAGDPEEPALSSYAQKLHQRWELKSDAVRQRRQEDMIAAAILGADYLHGQIPDCIYRRNQLTGEPCYISDEEIFGAIDPTEENLANELAEQLGALPNAKQILVPLGVGNHIDHQIARKAAEKKFGEHLVYYEEFPYAGEDEAVNLVIGKRTAEFQAQVIPIPEEALAVKIEAIAAYKSQLSTFFRDQHDLERQVRHYAEAIGGERIWYDKSLSAPDLEGT
jgi:LmbE family N-acetylglucosaminyl deacetylase